MSNESACTRPSRILVFQHIACEHPAIFRDFLHDDGIAWDAVHLDQGQPIPDLDKYDMLWVMGGPMDVWQESDHPWLIEEKSAIREWVVDRKMPFFGLCLGHQLLAAALGGTVAPAKQVEIGMMKVSLTEAGRAHTLFDGIDTTISCLQWHGSEVVETPANATVLAGSEACRVQALAVGQHAFSLQYHVELTQRTIAEWGEVPAYARSLEATFGKGGLQRLGEDARLVLPALNRTARQLYSNAMRIWMGSTDRPA